MIRKSLLIVAGILVFSSTCFAASDEELGRLSDKMSGAFRCSVYAGMFDDLKDQQRLFQIGLKAARDFVEGMKSRDDNNPVKGLQTYMPGASTDFLVGQMYDLQEKQADTEVSGIGRRLDPSQEKNEAEIIYHKNNCSLIQ
jgi:hypothetical protein